MASGSPEHHMDRLGRRLDNRSCNPVLAPEEWVGSLTPPQIVDPISLTLRGALFKEGSPPHFCEEATMAKADCRTSLKRQWRIISVGGKLRICKISSEFSPIILRRSLQ